MTEAEGHEQFDLVVRGGTVIDGTGGPRRRADVGVIDGRIVEIGACDGQATREIDAAGAIVAPGVIDIHTHYDAQLFWDPAATPSSLHGVTTVIAGNCGFSISPLGAGQAEYLSEMLARVEGIPLASLKAGVPWGWRTFGEYLDALDGRVAVNVGFLVGHTALRRAVLGADDERPVTSDELEQLLELFDESLEAGGLGLSSSLATSHNDANGRPVSSRYADREELLALCEVVRRHEGTTLEFIPSVAAEFSDEDVELMAQMSATADRPLNWNLLLVNTLLESSFRQRLGASVSAGQKGGRVVPLMMPMMSTLRLNFISGFVLDTFRNWVDLFEMSIPDRLDALVDPTRRAAMRAGVEREDTVLTRRMRNWPNLVIGQTFSDDLRRFDGRSLGDIAAETGNDPFEQLLDIVVADELRTLIVLPPVGNDPDSWALRAEVWDDPAVVIGGSDSGAHMDMIDTFTYSTSFLGPIVRDGWIELERAVQLITSAPADLYGIRDRGRLVLGARADMIVFHPDEIGPGQVYFRNDLPGDESRLFADPTGIRCVLVEGTEIVEGGRVTGARPGRVLRSGRDTATVSVAGSHA